MNNFIKIKSYENQTSYNISPDKAPKVINKRVFDECFKQDKKFHEILCNTDFVKFYFDIDMGYKTEDEMKEGYKYLLKLWTDKLVNLFKCNENDLGISESSRYKLNPSSKKDKTNNIHYFVSIHIIVNNHYILKGELKEYNEKVLNLKNKIDGYDSSVYGDNRCFRMIMQSKPEVNNNITCFKPVNNKDLLHYHIIQMTSDYDLSKYKLHTLNQIENEYIEIEIPKNNFEKVSNEELEKYVMGIKKQYNEYDNWIHIGMAIFNETNGSNEGLQLYKKWSKVDIDNYEETTINNFWYNWNNNQDKQKWTFGTIKHFYDIENPIVNVKNIYKDIYNSGYKKEIDEEDDKISYSGKCNIKGVIEELNKKIIYVRQTSEIIFLDNNDKWYLKKEVALKSTFSKYTFFDLKTKRKINPVSLWLESDNRREVQEINFDPSDIEKEDIFNIWKGFKINKESAQIFNIEDCKPLLDHIYKRWCSNDEEEYNYILNYLAHILQYPYKKIGVVLCLRSRKEGSGKGIVLNKLQKIIGDNHYFQCNNLNQLTSDFNGITEGKVLINLDEAFWGKDRSKEGMLKNLITESKKLINKKGKEAYIIDDYCNYILTTNNDCFIPAVEDGRRFYALECSNELSGIMSKEKEKIINDLLNVPSGSFAKYLFNRDITDFNPRIFNKNELLQNQVEQNWDNIKTWWFDVLTERRFYGNKSNSSYCSFGDIPINNEKEENKLYGFCKNKFVYDKNRNKIKDQNGKYLCRNINVIDKDFFYNNYLDNIVNGYKFSKKGFYEKFKKECIGDELFKFKRYRNQSKDKYFIELDDIEVYQQAFNKLENYTYIYDDDYASDTDSDYDSDYNSDDE